MCGVAGDGCLVFLVKLLLSSLSICYCSMENQYSEVKKKINNSLIIRLLLSHEGLPSLHFCRVCTCRQNNTAAWVAGSWSLMLYWSFCYYYVSWAVETPCSVRLSLCWVLGRFAVWSHVTINLCLPRYLPNLWCCCHRWAAVTNSSQSCLDAIGLLSMTDSGVWRNFKASLWSCCAPPEYRWVIWLLIQECMILWCVELLPWSSLLRCSHMSHEMSHSFWMKVNIHLKLDFHNFTHGQTCVW